MPNGIRRVLVAEDDPACRNVLRFTLEHAGFKVAVARDGQTAWGLLNESDFDLVLTDFAMPRMSGRELVERMRRDERFSAMPVILLTGRDSGLKATCSPGKMNVDAIISKPFSPSQVKRRIEECLAANRRAD